MSYWQNIRSDVAQWSRRFNDAMRELKKNVEDLTRTVSHVDDNVSRNNKQYLDATREIREIRSAFIGYDLEIKRLDRENEQLRAWVKTLNSRIDASEAEEQLIDIPESLVTEPEK